MSKIVWDKTGERYFETGLYHGVLYPMNRSSAAYEKGVAWNGLTSFNEQPSGAEPTDLYADNMKYATLRSAEDLGGTLEAYTYPDEFAECDGSVEVVKGVKLHQQDRKSFGLCYTTKKGSDTNTSADTDIIHVIWNASASPSERSYQTINDSPEAITFSWEITTIPVEVGGGFKPTSLMTIDTSALDESKKNALYDKLFGTESTEPELPTPADLMTLLGYAAA